MKKKIILKESQFRRLVESRTINMLMEDSRNESITLDFGKTFQSGQFKIQPEDRIKVTELLSQVEVFFKRNSNSLIRINVLGSESRVPNNVNPETGERFAPQELAEKRTAVVKEILADHLSKLGIKPNQYEINSKHKIGGPEWTQDQDANDPKFTQHQFVRVELSLSGGELLQVKSVEPENEIKLNLPEPKFVNGEMDLHIRFVQSKADYLDDREAREQINKVAEYLRQNVNKKVMIQGHVSGENPNENLNRQLSVERAKRVTKELIKMGVPRQQLQPPVGYGSARPKKRWQDVSSDYNSQEAKEARALNRRIVAKVI